MNKQQFIILISVIIAGILFATNPKESDHRSAVKDKANLIFQKVMKEKSDGNDATAGFGLLLGGYLVDRVIETAVTRDNYLLFSLTKIRFQDQDKTIGFGMLGAVFVSSKVDEALAEKKKQTTP